MRCRTPFLRVIKGIQVPNANISLTDQLRWFKELFLPKFYRNPADCKRFMEASLVIVGEIGGNDYNHALLLEGESMESVETFLPHVVSAITSTINELIKLGAVTLMVPGNFPIGCSATYLTQFKSSNQNNYHPKTGCIKWLNEFATHHNKLLQSELNRIQKENPTTKIIYADYYNAAMRFYRSPLEYAYRVVATGLIKESYTIPRINCLCVLSSNYGVLNLSNQ
ncbi:acetylajmaline esterase [Salvia divinorum]|uniref:Acetylajmaline esterase n=1 Tax=Salvia divinorum TaxID=28513 RepID=A0ABD1HV06_SALDI